MPRNLLPTLGVGLMNSFLLLCCVSCSSLPPVQAPPQLVQATETRWVGIPAPKTDPCDAPADGYASNRQLLQHDQAEHRARVCDEGKLADIAKMQGQPVPAAALVTAAPAIPATTPPPQPRL